MGSLAMLESNPFCMILKVSQANSIDGFNSHLLYQEVLQFKIFVATFSYEPNNKYEYESGEGSQES